MKRVNIQRKLDNPNKVHVGLDVIRSCVKRLKSDISAVQERHQVSTDPNSPWVRVRYDQFHQFRL